MRLLNSMYQLYVNILFTCCACLTIVINTSSCIQTLRRSAARDFPYMRHMRLHTVSPRYHARNPSLQTSLGANSRMYNTVPSQAGIEQMHYSMTDMTWSCACLRAPQRHAGRCSGPLSVESHDGSGKPWGCITSKLCISTPLSQMSTLDPANGSLALRPRPCCCWVSVIERSWAGDTQSSQYETTWQGPLPVAKAEHLLLPVLDALQEGANVVHAANAL